MRDLILYNIELVIYTDHNTLNVVRNNAEEAIESLAFAFNELMQCFSKNKLKANRGKFLLLTS